MVDIVTKRNGVYQTAYHVIWCPKYRRDVLIGAAAEETGAMLDLGFPLNRAFCDQLMKSKHVMTVHVADKKKHDMKIVPVVVRKWDMDELG